MGGGTHTAFFSSRRGNDCQKLIIKTQLFSPDPDIIKEISVGDTLPVKILSPKGPCVVTKSGQTAGTIISKELFQLIECINKGFDFEAHVRQIIGGECSVTIKAIK